MKKIVVLIVLASFVITLSSCNSEENTAQVPSSNVFENNKDISATAEKDTKKTDENPEKKDITNEKIKEEEPKKENTEIKNTKEDVPEKNEIPQSSSEVPNKPSTPPSPPTQGVSSSSPLAPNLDRTKRGFGYSPNKTNTQVAIGQKYENMMNQYNSFFIDRANTNTIYLTMDEGYENGFTPLILDTLKNKNVKATFFITMPYLKSHPELVERMINEGHIVGNHTVNHLSLPTLSNDKLTQEIMTLHNEVKSKFGYEMQYLRPPMGEYSENVLALANSLGYKCVFWSFAYRDWETDKQRGSDYAVNSVMGGVHNGCVMLLHPVSRDNAEGLGEIIDNLTASGYVFGPITNIK